MSENNVGPSRVGSVLLTIGALIGVVALTFFSVGDSFNSKIEAAAEPGLISLFSQIDEFVEENNIAPGSVVAGGSRESEIVITDSATQKEFVIELEKQTEEAPQQQLIPTGETVIFLPSVQPYYTIDGTVENYSLETYVDRNDSKPAFVYHSADIREKMNSETVKE